MDIYPIHARHVDTGSAGQPPYIECVRANAIPSPLWLQEREKGGFIQEMEEEFEDRAGNVYNKKTYEDLRRQGLI